MPVALLRELVAVHTATNNLSNTDYSSHDIAANHSPAAGHSSTLINRTELVAANLEPKCLIFLHLLIFVNNDNYKRDAIRFSDLPKTYLLVACCTQGIKPIRLTT